MKNPVQFFFFYSNLSNKVQPQPTSPWCSSSSYADYSISIFKRSHSQGWEVSSLLLNQNAIQQNLPSS